MPGQRSGVGEHWAVLPTQQNVLYVVDAMYRILAVNSSYRLACEGVDPDTFLGRWGVGCCVLDTMSDGLRRFHEQLLERTLLGRVVEHQYQCHTPDRYREFRMRLLPQPSEASVLIEHALVIDRAMPLEPLPTAVALVQWYERGGMVTQCAHCRKVRRAGTDRWDWVPTYVARPHPNTSHGLCAVCLEYYYPKDGT